MRISFFLLFLFSFIVIYVPSAHAETHLVMSIRIDPVNQRLHIQGSSNKPVHLPDKTEMVTTFDYVWSYQDVTSCLPCDDSNTVNGDSLFFSRAWFPDNGDLFTYRIRVQSPMVAILSGTISDEFEDQQTYHAQFDQLQPTETLLLVAGPYQISEIQHKNIKLRTYFYDEQNEFARSYLNKSIEYIENYEQLIAPFPFSSFSIIATKSPSGLGFAGLTTLYERLIPLPFILETSLKHEILHNYWGNGVFIDYNAGNWAEGLTTYLADYLSQEKISSENAKEMRLSWLRDYNAIRKENDFPVADFKAPFDQTSRIIGYNKVAFIFHMLRQKIGDQAFYSALKSFWQSHRFKKANWQDIEKTFTQVTNLDLKVFFAQWVTQKGAPTFMSITADSQKTSQNKWSLSARLIQKNPAYHVEVPVQIGFGNMVLNNRLIADSGVTQSNIILDKRPVALSLDPDFHLFRTLGSDETQPVLRDLFLQNKITLVLTPSFASVRTELLEASKRLFPDLSPSSHFTLPSTPFILITDLGESDHILSKWGLPPISFSVHDTQTARLSVQKFQKKMPYLVIEAKDKGSLIGLWSKLRHYGNRQSLVFNNENVIFTSNGDTHPVSVPVY